MRVAYVTIGDPDNPFAWSGTARYMAKSLERQGIEVLRIGNLREAWAPLFKAKHALHKLLGHSYTRIREPLILKGFARQIRAALDRQPVDAIVAPDSVPVARLDGPEPIFTWCDATMAAMRDYYPSVRRLTAGSVRMAMAQERDAMRRARISFFASTWAAESAVRDYATPPQRVRVVPFGAILDRAPDAAAVERAIADRPLDRCRLVFIGIDWDRKGGPVALAAAEAMNRAGVPTELHVLGAQPPGPLPPFVKLLGFVDKFKDPGRGTFEQLLLDAHFLLLPSQAEAFGMAPCEGNAFGVPALVAATGGLAEVIHEGRNGLALPPGTPGSVYARHMLDLLADPARYRALCAGARREYETRLNWDSAAAEVKRVMEEAIAQNHPSRAV